MPFPPRPPLVALALLVAGSVGCGPAPRPRGPTPEDLLDITEGRALELISEVAADSGTGLEADWRIDVGEDEPFSVDVRLTDTSFGIEWVSPQDRADFGDLLPAPNARQLQVIPGAGDDAEAQILIVDHGNYRYDPDLERVQRGSRGAREAEASVRNYIRDYFEYVRGQGAI
jgi:hypothetical protein